MIGSKETLFQTNNSSYKSSVKEGFSKIKGKKGQPKEWVNNIIKFGGKGTTQELEWIGLLDYLENYKKDNNVKSIPREVVEEFLKNNQIKIVNVTKDLNPTEDAQKKALERKRAELREVQDEIDSLNVIKVTLDHLIRNKNSRLKELEDKKYAIKESIRNSEEKNKKTDHTGRKLKGGENYREVLIILEGGREENERLLEKREDELDEVISYI